MDFLDYHRRKAMKNPAHPGSIVRELCLVPLGLSVTAAAKGLGVSRQALNNVLNERAAISAEMAIRLELGFGSKAETWLAMQMAFDLAAAQKRMRRVRVKPLQPGHASAA